jgi:hypothetical protein
MALRSCVTWTSMLCWAMWAWSDYARILRRDVSTAKPTPTPDHIPTATLETTLTGLGSAKATRTRLWHYLCPWSRTANDPSKKMPQEERLTRNPHGLSDAAILILVQHLFCPECIYSIGSQRGWVCRQCGYDCKPLAKRAYPRI